MRVFSMLFGTEWGRSSPEKSQLNYHEIAVVKKKERIPAHIERAFLPSNFEDLEVYLRESAQIVEMAVPERYRIVLEGGKHREIVCESDDEQHRRWYEIFQLEQQVDVRYVPAFLGLSRKIIDIQPLVQPSLMMPAT